jgi:hypothetical protein
MVFDTGSAHIVVPSAACRSESCLKHKQYNVSESASGLKVNADFSEVRPGYNGDSSRIGFGSGHIEGPFVYEKVCLGGSDGPCMKMGVITATEMSQRPFLTSEFDGIFGLSFDAIAISEYFSFYKMLSRANNRPGTPESHRAALQFGIYLTEVDSPMRSELTLGGYNVDRILTPLKSVPVLDPASGHWMVKIIGIKVGGVLLNMCSEADRCIGAVDSGSSHLGVPWDYHREIMDLITGEGVEGTDCRYIEGLPLEIMLDGFTIELTPENYNRKIALPPDVKFRTMTGEAGAGIGDQHGPANASQNASQFHDTWNDPEPIYDDIVPWQCAPKMIPVKILEEMGKMFILGEPVLARYYTLYDWSTAEISFSLNTREQNQKAILQQQQMEEVADPTSEQLDTAALWLDTLDKSSELAVEELTLMERPTNQNETVQAIDTNETFTVMSEVGDALPTGEQLLRLAGGIGVHGGFDGVSFAQTDTQNSFRNLEQKIDAAHARGAEVGL